MSRVIIDIGHYKCDSGAVALGYKEVDFNYSIANKIADELKLNKVNVTFTYGSLGDRVAMENKIGCDYFVSIHCNSGGGSGTETFIHGRGGQAEKLANKIQTNLGKNLSIPNRGVRVAKEYLGNNLYVLKNTIAPAVLVECGFIDSKIDIEVLKHNQNKIAISIINAILEQLGITKKECDCCYCRSLRN